MNLPLNIDFRQILLHAFNFVILIGGLYILLYKPIKDFMDKRTAYYKDLDDKANKKLDEANKKQEELNKEIASVDEDINKARIEAHKAVEEEKAKMLEDARNKANEIIDEADRKSVV